MSTTDEDNNTTPHVSINAQYIKDLSFENPNAPESLVNINKPEVSFFINVKITDLSELSQSLESKEDSFEVEILIEAEATNEEKMMFKLELKYAGIFYIANILEEQKQVLLHVHCPSIIFPFARRIIADMTQSGGFQPLMIDPIDFGTLYHNKMMELEQNQD
ncbi:MAG: protein-export chaperone SecB [Rickettsiaceae bacterium]|nr:MAG: protein-export chaperone SecB [Rickettsiaceae bacterium]